MVYCTRNRLLSNGSLLYYAGEDGSGQVLLLPEPFCVDNFVVWSEGRVFFSALKCIPPRPLGVQDGQEKEQGEMDHEGLVSKSKKKNIFAIDITAAAAIVLQLLLLSHLCLIDQSSFSKNKAYGLWPFSS